jgi:hypothetical protein
MPPGEIGLVVVDEIKNEKMQLKVERNIFDWGNEPANVRWSFLTIQNNQIPLSSDKTLIADGQPKIRNPSNSNIDMAGIVEFPYSDRTKKAFKFTGDYSASDRKYIYHITLPRNHYCYEKLIFSIESGTADVISRKQTVDKDIDTMSVTQSITWSDCEKSKFLFYFFGPDVNKLNNLLNNKEMVINNQYLETNVSVENFRKYNDFSYPEVKYVIDKECQ